MSNLMNELLLLTVLWILPSLFPREQEWNMAFSPGLWLGREGSCVSNTWIVRVRVSPVFHLLKLQANAGGISALRDSLRVSQRWMSAQTAELHVRTTVNISGGSFFRSQRTSLRLVKLWTRLIWWPLKSSELQTIVHQLLLVKVILQKLPKTQNLGIFLEKKPQNKQKTKTEVSPFRYYWLRTNRKKLLHLTFCYAKLDTRVFKI